MENFQIGKLRGRLLFSLGKRTVTIFQWKLIFLRHFRMHVARGRLFLSKTVKVWRAQVQAHTLAATTCPCMQTRKNATIWYIRTYLFYWKLLRFKKTWTSPRWHPTALGRFFTQIPLLNHREPGWDSLLDLSKGRSRSERARRERSSLIPQSEKRRRKFTMAKYVKERNIFPSTGRLYLLTILNIKEIQAQQSINISSSLWPIFLSGLFGLS